MSTTTPITAEQLLELPSDGKRRELVAGELRMMSPSGWRHGEVVGRLHALVGAFVVAGNLGKTFGAETGFLLARDPDTVRAPDLAYLAQVSLPAQPPAEAFWPGPPDLAVEVLSPNDKTGEVDEKIRLWLNAGAKLVWVVDPQLGTVTVYRSMTDVEIKPRGSTLDGDSVIPGFSCEVSDIFPSPE